MLRAGDPAEAMRLHSEYLRSQMRSLQASEMGRIVGPHSGECRQVQKLTNSLLVEKEPRKPPNPKPGTRIRSGSAMRHRTLNCVRCTKLT
jgi:hypothetical protein